MKNTKIEIYNFLNITDRRLGRLYKYTGFSPLPKDFQITTEKIKKRIILNELKNENILPSFYLEDKKNIKKRFKISLKNAKKVKKHEFFAKNSSKKFAEEMETYFEMRITITEQILKDFKNHDFNEAMAYQELYNLDPVLAPFMEVLFADKVDFETLFENLEKDYHASYLEKVKTLEKKQNKEIEQKKKLENQQNLAKNLENSKKTRKKVEKINQNAKDSENKKDAKMVKEKIKKSKTDNKNKEKS